MTEQDKSQTLAPRPDDDEINLLDILLVLVKHKKLIIGSCAVTFVLACIITLLMPNIYTATARLLPPQKESGGLSAMMGNMGGLAALAGIDVGSGAGDLYVGMLESRTIADAIIERFDLMKKFDWETRTESYKEFGKLAKFGLEKKDGIISIQVDSEDPQLAAEIANAFIEELKGLNVQLNLNSTSLERQFLEERLRVVRADLLVAEERLKFFQEKNSTIKIDEQARTIIESIARLKGELASKEVELGVILSFQTEQNPQVKALRESINQIKDQLRRLEVSPEGKATSWDIFIGTSAVPELGVQFSRLMRDFKVQETLFELLTKQYEIAKITEAKNTSSIQILDAAYVPDKKSKPKRVVIVLAATFLAGFLAVFVSFVREFGERMDPDDQKRWQAIKRAVSLKT